MIRRLFIIALPLLILAAGLLTARYMLDTREEVAPSDEPVVEAGQPGDVATVTVVSHEPGTASPELVLYGQVLPERRVQVLARLGGDVTAVSVAEGQQVAAGDELVRIDATNAERQLARAENRLSELSTRSRQLQREQAAAEASLAIEDELVSIAERTVARTRDLQARNLASASDVDSAEQTLQQQRLSRRQQQLQVEGHEDRLEQLAVERRDLELEIEELEEQTGQALVRAPFAGEITALEVEADSRVAAEAPLLTLMDRERLRVEAQLPLRYAPVLETGMAAHLEASGTGVSEQPLTLSGWEPVSRGGSLRLRFTVDNPQALAVADGHHRLRLVLPPEEQVMVMPVNALYENRYVYRVDSEERLQRIAVTVVGFSGSGTDTRALVRSDDLEEGDRLLTTRLANAVTGLPVLVRED